MLAISRMENLSPNRVDEMLSTIRNRRVVVLGDVMLDEFVWGDVTRISPEAPVPVVDVRRESIHLGGAANVLANLISLGARSTIIGVVGDDAGGERLRDNLNSLGAGLDSLVIDKSRPSTLKTRIIAHNQLVVRADRERRNPVSAEIEDEIISHVKVALTDADAFVISDYDKGVITPRILAEVLPFAYERLPVLVDPKLRNFNSYRPATLVTPNHHEAMRMTNTEDDSNDGLYQAAKAIQSRLGCDAVLITCGDRGMMLLGDDDQPAYVRTAAREVYDVTGAGDTVIATLAAGLAVGATMLEAAMLANQAAGIVVGKVGTATANADELRSAFAG
jgi:D-beta-D-heptose 7-phosphate kinase/D-beta-D-heptose 1-phosphate adenosyltransferase